MISQARDSGIRVVGIDDTVARREPTINPADGNRSLEVRAARMNTAAASIISANQHTEQNRDSRYVILAGENHCHTHPLTHGAKNGHQRGQPGLSQLLGAMSVQASSGGAMKLLPEDKSNRGPQYQPQTPPSRAVNLNARVQNLAANVETVDNQQKAAPATSHHLVADQQLKPESLQLK